MKRLWFAVIFLVLAGLMCAGEQMYIDNLVGEMNAKINAAQAALENKDDREYEKKTAEIKKLWTEKNDILYAFGEHATLDTIAVQVRSMPYGRGDESKELQVLRAQIYAYYENEKISLSNIF